MIQARLREMGDEDHDLALVLRCKRRELLKLRRSMAPHNPVEAAAVITTWGPRIKDEMRFWEDASRIGDMIVLVEYPGSGTQCGIG